MEFREPVKLFTAHHQVKKWMARWLTRKIFHSLVATNIFGGTKKFTGNSWVISWIISATLLRFLACRELKVLFFRVFLPPHALSTNDFYYAKIDDKLFPRLSWNQKQKLLKNLFNFFNRETLKRENLIELKFGRTQTKTAENTGVGLDMNFEVLDVLNVDRNPLLWERL